MRVEGAPAGQGGEREATMRQTGHTHGLSIVVAPELIWRFSYNYYYLFHIPILVRNKEEIRGEKNSNEERTLE